MVSDRMKKQAGKAAIAIFRAALMILMVFVVIYPLLRRMVMSFMSISDLHDLSVKLIPRQPTLLNYQEAWRKLNLSVTYLLTIEFSLLVSLLQAFICAVVGFGLARYPTRLNRIVFLVAIIGLAVPPELLLVPIYNHFRYFDLYGIFRLLGLESQSLINTQWPMLILAVTGCGYRCGLYILLMRQNCRGIPRELDESAYIDGANALQVFSYVILPCMRTMMVVVALFSFVWSWLDNTYSPILMTDYPLLSTKLETLNMIDVSSLVGTDISSRNLVMSAGVMYLILPLLFLYLLAQRQFVQGIERSGLVG